ncbi:Cell surface superoxide dismutase [Cu-Zn] 4 [Lithohypha guttulata]|uniref:Cell surface superoxide dismutase [Cu-Zn] 4 n=1 Tax=Lithohypha guttulata TaxID=1690604 RepID=UPI002DDED0EB|nr:Cell surface superoxide dismutase [Cu-Zn] 4 [Lithohypha guttulata]
MFSTTLTIFTLCAGIFAQQPAPIITNNLPATGYYASLTSGPGSIKGDIVLEAATDGTGMNVKISWNGFDLADSTEYIYHIHQFKVPETGNCNSTGAHFDPYGVGEGPEDVCEVSRPETCQLGDLSGKHGAITFMNDTNPSRSLEYLEEYLSTDPNDTAFFGNLSIVVHKKNNKFRLNCGNFAPLADRAAGTGTSPTYPNTTSTDVVATMTVTGSGTGAADSTSTAVVPGSTTRTTGATSSGGSGIQQSSEAAVQNFGGHLMLLLIGLAGVVCFI